MRRRGIILWVAYLLTLLIAGSCGSALKIEGPPESYTPEAFLPSPSVLPIVAEIDLKGLERSVNRRFEGLLYENTGEEKKDLEIKVWKAGNFSVFANNDEISYRIPLKIWSRFSWKVEKFGLSISDKYEATGSLALIYKTKFNVDSEWNLKTRTTSAGYNWIESPKMSIAGVSIPVKPIADFALSKTERQITREIDKSIAESFNLREYVEGFWNYLQEPVQVDSTFDVWVKITPAGIALSPIGSASGKLLIPVTFTGEVESIAGDSIKVSSPVALPPLGKNQDNPGKFNINVKADVTFSQITKAAMMQLAGMEFKEGGKSILVKGLNLYSSSGKAVLEMDVEGSLKGRLYLTGELVYNPDSLSVSVINPEFDVKTRNALVKSANWLLHGMLLRKLQPYLTYKIDSLLEDVRLETDNMLKKYSLMEGVYLMGNLHAVKVTNISMIPGAVRINASLSGDVKIITTDF